MNKLKAKSFLLTTSIHISIHKIKPHKEWFCTAFAWLQGSDSELRERRDFIFTPADIWRHFKLLHERGLPLTISKGRAAAKPQTIHRAAPTSQKRILESKLPIVVTLRNPVVGCPINMINPSICYQALIWETNINQPRLVNRRLRQAQYPVWENILPSFHTVCRFYCSFHLTHIPVTTAIFI